MANSLAQMVKPVNRFTPVGTLHTDEYQLTVSQLYFRPGRHNKWAQFHHFFRSYPGCVPLGAGYCINTRLERLLDCMRGARFRDEAVENLRSPRRPAGERIFADDFLNWLRAYGTFDAAATRTFPEVRTVHPAVPLAVTHDPLAVAQTRATPLLNHVSRQTFIATKAARKRESSRGQPVVEIGVRRDRERGANPGARAALASGADFTSNVGISHMLGHPPKATYAHSMAQASMTLGEGDLGAFRAYADVFSDGCLLLVDTIDALECDLPNAITVFEELRRESHVPPGVRLNTDDLAHLSVRAATVLDKTSFPDSRVVLSNRLDEPVALQIMTRTRVKALRCGSDVAGITSRLISGVGARPVTSEGSPGPNGLYKLVAVHDGGTWLPAIKNSVTPTKTRNPCDKYASHLLDRSHRVTAGPPGIADENQRETALRLLRHTTEHIAYEVRRAVDTSETEPAREDVLAAGSLVCNLPASAGHRRDSRATPNRLEKTGSKGQTSQQPTYLSRLTIRATMESPARSDRVCRTAPAMRPTRDVVPVRSSPPRLHIHPVNRSALRFFTIAACDLLRLSLNNSPTPSSLRQTRVATPKPEGASPATDVYPDGLSSL